MPLVYARRSWLLLRQLTADLFVLVWSVGWALLGILVHRLVAALAGPARATANALREVAADFQGAADRAGGVPGIGENLRRPFMEAVERLGTVIAAADQQVVAIERLATVLGWLTFVLPVGMVLAVWLPLRLRFIRRMRAAQRFLHSGAALDLFALRSLAYQPLHVLTQISPDPAAAWRAGDREAIDALADLELRRCGLRLDRDRRATQLQRTSDRA
jgi:hypothetical protein